MKGVAAGKKSRSQSENNTVASEVLGDKYSRSFKALLTEGDRGGQVISSYEEKRLRT